MLREQDQLLPLSSGRLGDRASLPSGQGRAVPEVRKQHFEGGKHQEALEVGPTLFLSPPCPSLAGGKQLH